MHRLCQQGKPLSSQIFWQPALEDIFRNPLVSPWRTVAYHITTMILGGADCYDDLRIQLSIHIDASGAFAFGAAVAC